MINTYNVSPDIDVLTSSFPIPGFGLVPINAFVLHGREPLLVDTGAVVEHEEFMTALGKVIDPTTLRWVWLTHTDFDHIGSLHRLLAENGNIRLITTFLGAGIMSLSNPLPMHRLYLVNPGQQVQAGDRTLTAVKPPVFDNPSTTGFFDHKSGAFFSSDCFGALLSQVPQRADDLAEQDLRQGQIFWATVDSPWLHKADCDVLARELNQIREMDASMILSSHLPPASGGMTDRLLASVEAAPKAQPFVGPDQAALEQMLSQMTGQQPA